MTRQPVPATAAEARSASSGCAVRWPQDWYRGGTSLMLIDPDHSVRPVITYMVPLQMGES